MGKSLPEIIIDGRSVLRCVPGNDISALTNLAEENKMANSVTVYTQPG
jgi:hypothetical protein